MRVLGAVFFIQAAWTFGGEVSRQQLGIETGKVANAANISQDEKVRSERRAPIMSRRSPRHEEASPRCLRVVAQLVSEKKRRIGIINFITFKF